MNNDPQHVGSKREETCPGKKDKLDLGSVTAEIEKKNGPEFWRSLEELAGNEEFKQMMHREFPKGASEWLDAVSRRGFLKLMGSSLALAGMTGCTKQPFESIVPYVRQPEDFTPGVPKFYCTAFTLGGYGMPLLVTSREFRPIKVEGNDRHQATLGASDVFAQASLLDLYDPDRAQNVIYTGEISTWSALMSALQPALAEQKKSGGAGIRFLAQPFSSPTLGDQMQQVQKNLPQAKWHFYSPVNRDNVYEGARAAFGQPVETVYKLDAADVIVSLGADFLQSGYPGQTRYARDFARRRDPDSEKMNRLYVIESTPSATGAKADHRVPLSASRVEDYARFLASALGVTGTNAGTWNGPGAELTAPIVADLKAARGSSLIIAGDHQPAVVHALAHAMNASLGNAGKTVFYTDPILNFTGNQNDSLKALIDDMRAGKVEMLVILGGNPVYDAPADFGFYDALKNSPIPLRIHLGQHNDETSELCHWHVNETHYLEAWGDTRAYDGTVSIVQPLIAPLYGGKSALELLSVFAGQGESTGYAVVQNYWRSKHAGADFDLWWRKSLEQGWIEGTTFQPKSLTAKNASSPASDQNATNPGGIEVIFRPDPSTYDGRFANNGWLQELPKPMTKVTWDNPLLMGPQLAERLHVEKKDVVRLQMPDGKYLNLPVWVQAGHPDNSVTVFLGYGRRRVGRVGNDQGFNTYTLRTSAGVWSVGGAQITKTGGQYTLASTQGYQTMDVGEDLRPLVRTATLEEYKKEANFNEDAPQDDEMLYNETRRQQSVNHEAYAWGMAIDMNACVGCNTCIIACQSENNIAIVGKEQVNRGRHMHWLRVDAYYQGDRDNPKVYFQPVPCMQCEEAPCEIVCPVGATSHSTEGLNDMIYNRCVGTRYCSNNCPYKVRRFNFFLFQDWDTPQFKMARNPEVSVRSRGVMEKCTYCVQRITQHRIDAERTEDQSEKQGIIASLQTACQQACPANAIVFGNLNDPGSQVAKLKAKNRNYALLGDLNTRPRTTYLAEITNPNPELKTSS